MAIQKKVSRRLESEEFCTLSTNGKPTDCDLAEPSHDQSKPNRHKKRGRRKRRSETQENEPDATLQRDPLVSAKQIVWFVAVGGAISFCCEILFTRMLGHFLGGSVYAFATMLAGLPDAMTSHCLPSRKWVICWRFSFPLGSCLQRTWSVQSNKVAPVLQNEQFFPNTPRQQLDKIRGYLSRVMKH